MKRLILSASLMLVGLSVLTPVALANQQASTPGSISETATVHNLILHNRDVRGKK